MSLRWLAAVNISGRTAPTTQKMLDFPKAVSILGPSYLNCQNVLRPKKKNLL